MNEHIARIFSQLKIIKNVIETADAYETRKQINMLERIASRFFEDTSYAELIADAEEANEELIENDSQDEDTENHIFDLLSIAIENMENELKVFGLPGKQDPKIGHSVTINNQHHIHQSQTVTVELLKEALRYSLTGQQLKEVEDIVKNEKDPARAKSKVVDKLASFGSNVLSNVLASVITNPHLITSIF